MADTDNIYTKLRQVQLELKAPKSQYNSFGKYSYRNVEDILEAVKPLCVKHGLTLVVSDEIVLIGERYYIKAVAGVFDGNDSHLTACGYAREADDKKGMDESQITGAASSYARKYALNGLFAIDDTKDADSQDHSQKQSYSQPQSVARPKGNGPATDKQKGLVNALLRERGIAPSEMIGYIEMLGVSVPLTVDGASEVIEKMKQPTAIKGEG